MSGSWTRTDHFTYFTDPQSGSTHRTGDQVWTFPYPGDGSRTYIIPVSGPNQQPGYVGQHNAFAKKHLLTFKGGKAAARGDEVGDKIARMHEHRRFDDFDEYDAMRQKKHGLMSANGQAQFVVKGLGQKAMNLGNQGQVYENSSTLSVVICDWISPEKLRYAFAKAIKNANPVTGQTYQHVVVSFGDNQCVLRHNFETNGTTKTNQITVTFYCHSRSHAQTEAHVVHCSA